MGRRVEIEAEFPDAGIGLLVVREPPTRLAEHDHRDVQVSLTGRNARYAVAWHGAAGRSQRSPDAAPGLMVVPSGAPHQVDWTAEAGAVHLYLSPGLLAGVAVDRGLREGLNLRPTFNAVDPVLEGLARSFAAECRIGPPARAAMESLAYVVATRLVAGYAESARGLQGPPQGVLGGLALRRSIDYALSHLGEDVGVGEMARAAGVSPTHFITLFRRSTGLTPYRYLVRRRLDRARELIRTGRPLALIAVETGFHDQSHLTRRMRLEDGTTPRRLPSNDALRRIVPKSPIRHLVVERVILLPLLALAHAAHASDPFAPQDAELKAQWSRIDFERRFAHRTAQVGEVRLHYVIGGKGDPIVLLHGFPATWYDYRLVMPELGRSHTVIAVDLRGLGDSSRPTSGYDARTVAADVAGLVRLLGFRQIDLVGHDIGAPVAYAYAKANPAGVRRLVEMEFVLAGAGLEELEAKQSPNLWFFQFQAVHDLPEALVAGRERAYLSAFFNGFTASGSGIAPEAMDEYVRAYSQPGAFRAGFEYYRAVPTVAKQTQEDRMAKLSMPVLALAGDHSMGASGLGDPAKASITQLASDYRYEVVPDSGHWIAEERPAWLADRLARFLGEGK